VLEGIKVIHCIGDKKFFRLKVHLKLLNLHKESAKVQAALPTHRYSHFDEKNNH